MERPFYRYASEVAFRDTDASGWLHFTNVFHHVERAEHACLEACGLLVFSRDQGGWPRVRVTCDYKKPLLCGEKIEIQLKVAALGTASVTWDFEVLNPAGETAAFGSITTVRVTREGRPQALNPTERAALERGL